MAFKNALAALVMALPLVAGLRTKRALCPDGIHTATNAACCNLFPVVKDITENLFENECGDGAHGALRLVFHDAIGISPTLGGGGADGSIAVFNETELTFHANTGIDDVLDALGPFLIKHSDKVTPGDFIQLAGAVSLVQCNGAPRIPFLLGRAPPKAASPPDLVPEPFDSIPKILQRFKEVGFSPAEVVAVVGGSHSVAGADDIVPNLEGVPFDQTPDVFDTQIFVDVQLRGTMFPGNGTTEGEVETAVPGTVRLQSDHLLARDPATNCEWQSFVNNQAKMAKAFGDAVFKLSLLGQDPRKMIDCSEVIPKAIPFTGGPATFPPGKTIKDIEQAVSVPFEKYHGRREALIVEY
ncbi:Versatile peroxidase VPL1 [Psilocybe cubensis]|uniref:Versatile peroxidase VPL1 n=1 Tax=Psilocybe cubensis TaxID=181762 RepID=A0ACB8H5U3_PSICU|nr:Versatile peroxidase VPL1 [Psilocybe cubensis]KAH9483363.1 Versatile peroxidase VPL1 [Psilocybe cubensis]